MVVDERTEQTALPSQTTPAQPPQRRPYWPAALLLLGLLVAVLGAALVLDQRFRPRVGVEPASVVAVASQPAVAAPTVANPPTAAAKPTAAPTATAPATAVPTAPPTVQPGNSPVAVAAVASPPPKSAAELLTPLHREIIDAYLRYWAVRIQAYYDLDTSHLNEVMAEAELAREEQGVQELRAQGRGADIDIEHNFRITKATDTEAVVYDEYLNHSVFIDAATKQEIPTKEPPGVLKISFQMKKSQGVWKVVDGRRHD